MSAPNEISIADAFDRSRRRMALAMLALSVVYAVGAASHVLGPEFDQILRYLGIAAAVVAVGAVLSIVYWKLFKLSSDDRHLYFSTDGFVIDTVRRATNVSWVVTFLALMLLKGFADGTELTQLPSEFLLQAVLALMLAVSSTVFFVLNRAGGEGEAEQDSRA